MNKYEFMDNVVIGYDNKQRTFRVSLCDFELIQGFHWRVDASGYVEAHKPGTSNQIIRLHILIMKPEHEQWVDHINRDRSDNTRENLRIVDARQNAQNKGLLSINTSGVSGVSLYKQTKWRARIGVDNKEILLGYFNTKDEAIKARLLAEIKYYGDYAPQKHLFQKYGITGDGDNELYNDDGNRGNRRIV